ncbi:DUF3800 domain-containing protein [Deinococcus petrolearius]|uniref:DUF3800 domain-containing protein n=1 Tax=Deinococcus petrolearius TaxID=1751295 RepID=A0ABW1DLG6_9DEIO
MHIYIDESEMEGNILLGAILVPDRHRYALERRLNDLRRRMLREMQILGYPILDSAQAALDRTSRQRTERVRLSAGGLPEIHAAELWAGDQVFWQQRDGTDALFHRHLQWLRAALDLMDGFGITYHTNSLTAVQERGKLTDREGDVFARLQPVLTKDISAKKFRKLQDDPFVRMLFGLMQALEQQGRGEGWTYQLVCDRGKKNEMFKTFETFETLKQHGRWRNLISTDFQDSSENALLQLCDAVTYVHAKARWLPAEHRHKALAQQLYRRSLRGQLSKGTADYFSNQDYNFADIVQANATKSSFAIGFRGAENTCPPHKRNGLKNNHFRWIAVRWAEVCIRCGRTTPPGW